MKRHHGKGRSARLRKALAERGLSEEMMAKNLSRAKRALRTERSKHKRVSPVAALRDCRDKMLEFGLLEAASYYADKVTSVSDDLEDLCVLVKIYNDLDLNARSEEFFNSRNIMSRISSVTNLKLLYEIAQCAFKLHKWDCVISILRTTLEKFSSDECKEVDSNCTSELKSAALYLLGLAHCNNNNVVTSRACLVKAMKVYPQNIAPFLWIMNNKIMTRSEGKQLVSSINFKELCGASWELIECLYNAKLCSHHDTDDFDSYIDILTNKYSLGNNHDVLIPQAEKKYILFDYKSCMKITKAIISTDFFNFRALVTHVACLSELKLYNDIYYIANRLIKAFPYNSITWYVVGVYYFTIKKNLAARGYFKRALKIDPSAAEAWIGFGHTFVEEGQIEQSLTAYSTSIRLMSGMHQPAMHMGTQHMFLCNYQLASEYFNMAYSIYPHDPALLNEMGTLCYREKNYQEAVDKFECALKLTATQDLNQDMLKIIYSNLANAYRRMKVYDKAIANYKKTLELDSLFVEAIMGLAYISEIFGNISESTLRYDKILSLRPDFFKVRDLLLCNIEELSIYAMDKYNWALKDCLEMDSASKAPECSPGKPRLTSESKMSLDSSSMCA